MQRTVNNLTRSKTMTRLLLIIILLSMILPGLITSPVGAESVVSFSPSLTTAIVTANSQRFESLIAQQNFGYTPKFDDFNVAETLDALNSPLASVTVVSETDQISAAESIRQAAERYAVNPRLLMTLVEVISRSITEPGSRAQAAAGYSLEDANGFASQASMLAARLTSNYEYFYVGKNPSSVIEYQDGALEDLEHFQLDVTSLAVIKTLAEVSTRESIYARVSDFIEQYEQWFGNPFVIPSYVERAGLPSNAKLPYAKGEKVNYTAGPHDGTHADPCSLKPVGNQSALDFAKGDFEVLSIAEGTFIKKSGTKINGPGYYVVIEHDGGIQSTYWHLADYSDELEAIAPGTEIPQGFRLGKAGNSGDPDGDMGVHLHLDLRIGITEDSTDSVVITAPQVTWDGKSLDGWTFYSMRTDGLASGINYRGTAVRQGFIGPLAARTIDRGYDCSNHSSVKAFVHPNYNGQYPRFPGETVVINESDTQFGVYVSDAKGAQGHVPSSNKPLGVILYEHSDYEGHLLALGDPDEDLCDNIIYGETANPYPCFDPNVLTWNDLASSMQMAPGWRAVLALHSRDWDIDEYGQAQAKLWCGTDIPDFTQEFFEGTAVTLNDNVSKVIVARCAPGASSQGLSVASADDPCAPDPPPSSDSATFLSDVTLPDGTVVSPGQTLHKVWRVRNSGSSTWGSGYQLVFVGGDQMGAPPAVGVPGTVGPDATVDLAVDMTAPSTPGTYTGRWRMRNAQGTYFGDELWIMIEVVGSTNGGDGHISAFSADPSSPSSANTVRFHAKVNWWPQFRAMRVRVDDQVIGETSATDYTFEWDTGSVSRGDHTVALEVAGQTDTSWTHPERQTMVYTLEGDPAPANHAPDRPSPSSPYDWYVYYSGNTAQLCAQANGDPDGDAVTGYYFDVYDSAQLWNSDWVGSNCVTTDALGPYNYQWRVKVRDSHGAESEWSDTWHFTLVNPSLSVDEMYFEPQDGSSEQVKIRACTTGQGGVGITMRVSVNDANDGSDSGEWHIIKELGVPCFNDVDVPVWNTLDYGDGPHLVRVEAHGTDTGWDGAAVREEAYTLPHRRPASPSLLAPVPQSQDIREAVYLNSRTVTFRWAPAIRANNYTLHISASPSPQDDPTPLFRQIFSSGVTEHTVTFDQDHPTLYWQVSAANDAGTTASGDQLFGVDRVAPSCTVQPLSSTTFESVFQVAWSGADALSGIRSFDIQYLDSDRGAWNDWLTGVPATKTYELFTGQPGHTYAFRCRATDEANNTGDYPADADTSTIVDPTARPPAPWWNSAYGEKRNLTILNNMPSIALPAGYPVHLHFDGGTSPTAAELYGASQSAPKCSDLRVVRDDTTELDRVVQNCSSDAIDIWFRTSVSIPGGSSDSTAHQLYYGNPGAGTPPGSPSTVFDPPGDGNTVGLWYMDEGSGSTLYDHSGHSRDCTIDPTTTWIEPSKFSGALHFLGGTDGPTVNCGSSSAFNLQAFTFEMFLKRTGAAWGRLAGHLGNDQNRWLLSLVDSGRIRVTIWPCPTCGAEEFTSNTAIDDTVGWHHVAFSLENSTVRIYIDGQLDFTGQVAAGNIRSGTPPFTIGSAEDIHRVFADVSHVRVSNVAHSNFPYGDFADITGEPAVATGDAIAPPETGSADLTILGLNSLPSPSGGALIQAVVQNQGNLDPKNGFYTDIYADPLPAGPGDYTGSVSFWVSDPITAGATVTLTTIITDLGDSLQGTAVRLSPQEQAAELYVQADSMGAVGESDDANNISTGISVCLASADAYEGDDTVATAQPIALGESQAHNSDSLADEDWVKFTATGGVTYTIQTGGLGSSADTYLYLYDTDGNTLLAANDDYGGSLASRIDWAAPATGTYYVLVKHWNPNVGGCGTIYNLSLSQGRMSRIYLPVVLRDYSLISPATATPSPTPTSTSISTSTPVPTSTSTPTNIPTNTPTSTATNTPTPTDTPTNTPTPTDTPTNTPTPTDTPTNTPTPTDTPTNTPTPTDTPTNTPTPVPYWCDSSSVALWDFDEGSGNTAHDSCNVHPGTLSGTYNWINGRHEDAVQFGDIGYQGKMAVSSSSRMDNMNNFTVEFWINRNCASTNDQIMGKSAPGAESWIVRMSDRRIEAEVYWGSGSTRVASNTQLGCDTWYHVAVSYDGSHVRIYINGALDKSAPNSNGVRHTSSGFWVADSGLVAGIDELRISDVARTSFPTP